MSQYSLNINGKIELGDYSNIYDYFSIVDSDDKFRISMNNCDIESFQVVCKMLQNNNFDIIATDECGDGNYEIEASRKKND